VKRFIILVFSVLGSFACTAQTRYTFLYPDSNSSTIAIRIQPATPLAAQVSFVMPRSIPGAYGIATYDKFITDITAMTTKGRQPMIKDKNDAPRWYYTDSTAPLLSIEYRVDLEKMERKIAPADASIMRTGFLGVLNYSVFGWIDGLEKKPVACRVQTMSSWSIFSTNTPTVAMNRGDLQFAADDYYSLADGQLFIGNRFRVKEFAGPVPLYIVSFCESQDEYLDDYAWQGIYSMNILKDYFGELPFKQYTILLRKAIPLEMGSAPTLAMEHLQSATFFGDTSGIRKAAMGKEDRVRTMPTYLHHMSHAFIPLRCYGDTYRPYPLEIPPIINNIWFNEGFMWFLPYDTLKLTSMKDGFYANVYKTSPYIKSLTLSQLSQIASTIYGTDFRLGRAVYSRGALMAIEMNDFLKEKSAGSRSMKDVFRYLYQWAKQNNRPFTMEEFPILISNACNIDLTAIYRKWQNPVE
jgi:predicted metalloprotease with PDZ domain